MTIQMMGAVLAQETYTDETGRFHIVDPIGLITLPVALRKEFEQSGKKRAVARLPDSVAVLLLWGGKPGEKYTLAGSFVYPSGHVVPMPVQEKTWENSPNVRLLVHQGGDIDFSRTGVFKFKFIINGEPTGELSLPILWEDELPA
ncbi:unnamed protein product [marine sediment metagenome]|uniref:Uncharacterized protein n=1 Tax=marine sediment metagenome TaxID=412755 RepID=X0U1G3_9ZZZZ